MHLFAAKGDRVGTVKWYIPKATDLTVSSVFVYILTRQPRARIMTDPKTFVSHEIKNKYANPKMLDPG
jgi:hypothetical protein